MADKDEDIIKVEYAPPELDQEAEVRALMATMEGSLRDALDRMKAEGDDVRRARLLRVLAARESELQEVKEEMERLHGIISDLGEGEDQRRVEAVTFATARMELEHIKDKRHLDFLGQLAHEAVGKGPGLPSIDVQACIRLQAFLAGTGVIGKAEDLQERLAIQEETNRRSEAARMGLHSQLATCREAITGLLYVAARAAGHKYPKATATQRQLEEDHAGDPVSRLALMKARKALGDTYWSEVDQEELDRLEGVDHG